MTTYIIDVSSWQADKHPTQEIYTLKTNPQQLIDTGCIGAIVRLCSGAWIDPAGVQFLEQLGGILPLGAYWYDHPEVKPEVCAQTFCRQVQKLGGLDAFKLGVWCDGPEVASVGTRIIDHIFSSLELVCADLHPDMKKTGIYTNKNFWSSNGGEGAKYREKALKYQLWAALWNAIPGVLPDGYRPLPWEKNQWLFHQYSADNNRLARQIGILSGDPDIDLNVFNPLLGRFESYFGVVKPQNVTIEESDNPLSGVVAQHGIRIAGLERWAQELAEKTAFEPVEVE